MSDFAILLIEIQPLSIRHRIANLNVVGHLIYISRRVDDDHFVSIGRNSPAICIPDICPLTCPVSKAPWVKSAEISKITGWNSDDLERARRNGYVNYPRQRLQRKAFPDAQSFFTVVNV